MPTEIKVSRSVKSDVIEYWVTDEETPEDWDSLTPEARLDWLLTRGEGYVADYGDEEVTDTIEVYSVMTFEEADLKEKRNA